MTILRLCWPDQDVFVGTIAEKLLTYALGRGLTPSDMPVVRGIVRNAAKDSYRFTSIIQGISMPFQMRTKLTDSSVVKTAAQVKE